MATREHAAEASREEEATVVPPHLLAEAPGLYVAWRPGTRTRRTRPFRAG